MQDTEEADPRAEVFGVRGSYYVVPAGGLSQDGDRWIHGPARFLLPVEILSEVFRGKFVDFLQRAWRKRELTLDGPLEELRHPWA